VYNFIFITGPYEQKISVRILLRFRPKQVRYKSSQVKEIYVTIRFTVGPTAPVWLVNGWIDQLNQALSDGFDGLRVTGSGGWLEKKDCIGQKIRLTYFFRAI